MSEISGVLTALEALSARGENLALATLVAVRGSTYRRPGARLLVPEHGEPIGNISAGCLESDVADVGRTVMAEGTPRLVSFDLTADDEAVWGWGLGCNGALELFVEPAEKAAEVATPLRIALEDERLVAMVTVLESSVPGVDPGARVVLEADGSSARSLGDPELDRCAVDAAIALLATERSEVRTLTSPSGDARAFVEVFEPPLRLLICGAGHDVAPLVSAAAALGWNAVVADDREAFLSRERFPGASAFVLVEHPAGVAEAAGVDERTWAVVMTHNFLRDKEYLRSLLASEARFIAMLGPGARTQRLLAELRDEGLELSEADEARIHGPAGLDLGAEGPEEIAAAITAEIIAVRRGRSGGFLRDRPGPIHGRRTATASDA